MDFSWLTTAGPYGGLVLVILWLSRTVIIADRRHESELRRIHSDHDKELSDLRGDILNLRTEIAELRVELRVERDARRDAEELAHRLRMGDLNATIDAPAPSGGVHRLGRVAAAGDRGALEGAGDPDDGDRPGRPGSERVPDRPR